MIDSPKLALTHPDRQSACADAMKDASFELMARGRAASAEDFQALAKRAQAAGWTPEEIADAFVSLGRKYVAGKASPNPSSAIPGDDRGEDAQF